MVKENKILKDSNNNFQNDLINLKNENENINNSFSLMNIKYNKLYEDYNNLKKTNETLTENNYHMNQIYRELKVKYDDLLKNNSPEKKEPTENKAIDIALVKSIPSKNIVGKLKQDLFINNKKNLELNKLIKQKEIEISNYEKEIKEKVSEINSFNKLIEDLKKMKNLEEQLKLKK